jgi:hypothetical protein
MMQDGYGCRIHDTGIEGKGRSMRMRDVRSVKNCRKNAQEAQEKPLRRFEFWNEHIPRLGGSGATSFLRILCIFAAKNSLPVLDGAAL